MEEENKSKKAKSTSLVLPSLARAFSHRMQGCSRLKRRSRSRGSSSSRKELMGCLRREPESVKRSGESDGEKAEVEVERKIRALQRLVPGGESLGVERLFEETAEYILALQGKVNSMRLIAGYFERLEKEKTKTGG